MTNVNKLVEKYTGVVIDIDEMQDSADTRSTSKTIEQHCDNLDYTEQQLMRAAKDAQRAADKVIANLQCAVDDVDNQPTLNPLGELQGRSLDTLIAIRHAQIEALKLLVKNI